MPDLESAALRSGATQLGEDGPDGAHFIFSGKQLEVFVRLVAGEGPSQEVLPPLPY